MRPLTPHLLILLFALTTVGCGTTRWTDTTRTSTEQLLISDAIDRSVSQIDLRPLSGQKVFLDSQFLEGTIDENYTVSVLRQHVLASGCRLMDKKGDAEYVLEARAGAIGTSRHDLLYGIPSTDLGSLAPVPGVPSRIPEVPLAKKTEQQGAAKIAVFAYHRETGLPYWQSGNAQVASTAKDIWVLGIGPFERGTIRDELKFAGDDIGLDRWSLEKRRDRRVGEEKVWVAESLQFHTPESIRYVERMEEQVRQAKLSEKPADKEAKAATQQPDAATKPAPTPAAPPATAGPGPPGGPYTPPPAPIPRATIRNAYVPQ
ncbi:MAG: hypothetical protein DWQ31_15450 [Planctomycetota bacterium]|nr:MAG: hypothetical protein DWQ31_15450 [Planctomycetota bacterium]REJ88870.1 MAG: hypothetical protein DWQ35_19215 [Planctomycetota bacterium]